MDTHFESRFRLIRLKEVLNITAISSSSHYLAITNGLMVKPIPLGAKSSAYPLHEIESIIAAKISGRSTNEIKELVSNLMEQRKSLS